MAAREVDDQALDELVAVVLSAARYSQISRDLIERVGRGHLARQRSLKQAVKETKSTLHQVAGAFSAQRPDYPLWLRDLERAASTGESDALRLACGRVLQAHASTRERLGLLDRFYGELLGDLPAVHSILDVACGLNPLTIPWMRLPRGASYQAYDIYNDLHDFLNTCLPLLGVQGQAHVGDVTGRPITQSADLALVLKALPTLDQLDKSAGMALLRTLDVPLMLVSFPSRSLGGREKGMPRTYEERFTAAAHAEGWSLQRFTFATELVFKVRKVPNSR